MIRSYRSRLFLLAGLLAFAAFAGCSSKSVITTPKLDGATGPATSSATIYSFGYCSLTPCDGAEPKGTLTFVTTNGQPMLYGRTAIGGNLVGNPSSSTGCGVVFSLPASPTGANGSYQVLYRFGGSDGCDPRHDAMTFDPGTGSFFSTTQGVNQGTLGTYGNQGQIFTFVPGSSIPNPIANIHTFTGNASGSQSDGAQQHSSFSIDPNNGMLYGQSAAGGANGDGELYAIAPGGGGFVDLHDFSKSEGKDPHGRIVQIGGTLWGITRKDGGSGSFGTVFSYALTSPLANGPVTIYHTFTGGSSDSALSDHGYLTPVTVNGQTILFGLTQCGGAGSSSDCSGTGDGAGTLFEIDPSAKPGKKEAYYLAHSFGSGSDGAEPYGSLMYDGKYLYATTSAGGAYGQGTVFYFAPPQTFGAPITPTVLYNFTGKGNDGAKPIDNVIEVNGYLYGMTVYGGRAGSSPDDHKVGGNGTIFALKVPSDSF